MQELVQVLTLLVSLSDFGATPNPRAPAPAQVLAYAVADADAFAYFDAQAVVPRNVRAFLALSDKAGLPAEVSSGLRDAAAKLTEQRAIAKAELGIDLIDDVHSIAAWLDVDAPMPKLLVAVRGNFPTGALKNAPALAGRLFDLEGTQAVRVGPMVAAMSGKGQLLIGSEDLVAPRLAAKWVAPRRTGAGAVAYQARALAERPIFALVTTPSDSARARTAEALGDEPTRLLTGQKRAYLAVHARGLTWSYTAQTDEGLATAVLASEGLLDLLRAGHFVTRGVVRVGLAVARAYADGHPVAAELVRRERDLLALAGDIAGDGRFVANVTKSPGQKTITVRARGKKLSDVVPAFGILPAMGAGAWLVLGRDDHTQAAAEADSQPTVPAAEPMAEAAPGRTGRPLDLREVYRAAKARAGMQ